MATPPDVRAHISKLPIEILREIIGLVWLDSIPKSSFRNIDPHGLPSAYPDGRKISSTQNATRRTLYNLCLVNRDFYQEARVLLFRRIQITFPHSFNLLLRTLGASHLASAYEKYAQTGSVNVDPTDPASFVNMVAAAGFAHALGHKLVIGAPTPTPPASRTQSPHPTSLKRRTSHRGKVQINADQDGEVELIWTEDDSSTPESPVYHVTLREEEDEDHASTLHKWVRLVDFSNFRTQGLRRTIGEGMERRFVTPARLLALVTAAEGLVAFGASETMDSALSNDVLEALLFRDGEYSKPSRLRGVSVERNSGRSNKMLQSLDLCECVSPRFHEAMKEFVDTHLKKFSGRVTNTVMEESEADDSHSAMDVDDDDEEEEEERGRGRSSAQHAVANKSHSRSVSTRRRDDDRPSRHPARATTFPSLQRLGLSGITLDNDLLNPFVLAFPRLTHLDLSRTKADSALLAALSSSVQLQLSSLSLAFCRRLTSDAITDLLVDAPCTQGLVELSLSGNVIFPTPIDSDDLLAIFSQAPCFRSGRLRYLDLGGCCLTDTLLDAIPPQPSLLDLGLSACPAISLDAISRLLLSRAPNVQVLELSDSCTSAASVSSFPSHEGSGINASHLQSVLIGPCAKTPPVSISAQLAMMGFTSGSDEVTAPARAATNLRIVGLNEASLQSVRGGIGSWKAIRGAGRRGWVVDTAAGPNPEATDDVLLDTEKLAPSASAVQMQITSSIDGLDQRSTFRNRSVRYSEDNINENFDDGRASRSHLRAPSASSSGSYVPSLRRAHSVGGGSGSRSRSRHPPSVAAPILSDVKLIPRDEVVRDLPVDHPRRKALQALADANGHVTGDTGWHSRKMEVLLGYGFLGRDTGLYALPSFQV